MTAVIGMRPTYCTEMNIGHIEEAMEHVYRGYRYTLRTEQGADGTLYMSAVITNQPPVPWRWRVQAEQNDHAAMQAERVHCAAWVRLYIDLLCLRAQGKSWR